MALFIELADGENDFKVVKVWDAHPYYAEDADLLFCNTDPTMDTDNIVVEEVKIKGMNVPDLKSHILDNLNNTIAAQVGPSFSWYEGYIYGILASHMIEEVDALELLKILADYKSTTQIGK